MGNTSCSDSKKIKQKSVLQSIPVPGTISSGIDSCRYAFVLAMLATLMLHSHSATPSLDPLFDPGTVHWLLQLSLIGVR